MKPVQNKIMETVKTMEVYNKEVCGKEPRTPRTKSRSFVGIRGFSVI
jgi:hypothetical protein